MIKDSIYHFKEENEVKRSFQCAMVKGVQKFDLDKKYGFATLKEGAF